MVIARVFGGVGNQLFIYAAARRLALKNGVPLKLDITSGFVRDDYQRVYCLHHFNIKADIATTYESFESFLGRERRYIKREMAKLLPFEKRTFIQEQSLGFDPRLINLKVKETIYLEGYWQSEQYFKDIEDVLRQELTIIPPPGSETLDIAKRIKQTNSVSLHVRCYNEVPKDRRTQVLPLDYYQHAIQAMAQYISNPHFFCFSDSPEWVQEYLHTGFPITFVVHNSLQGNEKAHEDLWLMSQCRHHIIANSTFSWWGAWLSMNAKTIVICPKFFDGWGHDGLIPENWHTL